MSNWNHIDGQLTLRTKSKGIASPIREIIASAAPKLAGGEEGKAVINIKPREQFPLRGNGDEYYHEAEVVIYGDLSGSYADEICDKIVDFVNYLIDNCDVHGDLTVEEDRTVKIADGFFVRSSRTFEILSRRKEFEKDFGSQPPASPKA